MLDRLPPAVQRLLDLAHVDFKPAYRPPTALRLAVATVTAIVASLVADAFLVVIGTALFPATKGYVHFQFGDYAKLTIIGVIIACLGWPVVPRITSVPRWLFVRMAILVTLVLWLPDLFLLVVLHQPLHAVLVLMSMHVAIALVTYNLLVHAAPVRARAVRRGAHFRAAAAGSAAPVAGEAAPETARRRIVRQDQMHPRAM